MKKLSIKDIVTEIKKNKDIPKKKFIIIVFKLKMKNKFYYFYFFYLF